MNFNNFFCHKIPLNENIVIQVTIFFTLLDNYIDFNYPNLEGESFSKKYKELPDNNDQQIIIKELYRIFKLLRNTVVHSLSNLEGKASVKISYNYRKTDFILDMSKLGFELLISLVLFLLDNQIKCQAYKTGIMRTYFKDIKSNIYKFEDEFGTDNFYQTNDNLYLCRRRRYQIINPKYQILKSKIKISKYKISDLEKSYAAADYYIIFKEQEYIVPNEVLNENGLISFKNLKAFLDVK